MSETVNETLHVAFYESSTDVRIVKASFNKNEIQTIIDSMNSLMKFLSIHRDSKIDKNIDLDYITEVVHEMSPHDKYFKATHNGANYYMVSM